MKHLLIAAIAAAAALTGCGITGHQEKAKSFIEQVAYQEAKAQGVQKSIDQLTCHKGYDAKGVCLDPGKPIRPAVAVGALEKIAKVRAALRATVRIPADGSIGMCLGKAQTAQACLLAASTMLLEVEELLRKHGG